MTINYPIELLAGLAVFSFASSITPGPNNIMILTSGVNFGFRRSVNHLLGISIGFFVMLLCVGAGLGALLTIYPRLFTALKIGAAIYLVYLSWRIAISRSLKSADDENARPMTFMEAALFQWINPKAWVMALTAMTLYVTETQPVASTIIVAAIFAIINLPCVGCWAGCGVALRQFLSVPVRLRIFNFIMGALLIASIVPIFLSDAA